MAMVMTQVLAVQSIFGDNFDLNGPQDLKTIFMPVIPANILPDIHIPTRGFDKPVYYRFSHNGAQYVVRSDGEYEEGDYSGAAERWRHETFLQLKQLYYWGK